MSQSDMWLVIYGREEANQWRTMEVLFLKQPLILSFLYHKSTTTSQIDSYEVSNSKLKLDLCICVETEMIESTAPPQQPHKRSKIFRDNPYKKHVFAFSFDLKKVSNFS